MFEIKPIEEVVTKRSVVVTLDEEEIAHVLVNPAWFAKQLRAVKATWHSNGSTWSQTGHADRRPKRARTEKKASERGQRCPKCRRIFKRLGRHASTCTGRFHDPLALKAAAAEDE